MFARFLQSEAQEFLSQFPAVALLGPRQVGKTTLAREIGDAQGALYLDLEHPADLAKLADPADYLARHQDKLVILDEIHRLPEVFPVLRSLIDEGRRAGRKSGRFLLLGSASMDLLRQSSESLAGRLATLELSGLTVTEVGAGMTEDLWLRGGFPDSLLAGNDEQSGRWRESFLRSYLERDIPQLGPRIPAETLRRFWTMLAHEQGGLLNAAQLARSLAVSGKTLASYIDLFVDLFLVRRLEPWHANVSKRLVKSPKIYLRDSGLLHQLLGIRDMENLLGHPRMGASWEGFVVENIIAHLPQGARACFFRSAAGAEIDLVLELPGRRQPWAVEIKRGRSPRLERGFHHAREDVKPERSLVVCGAEEPFPLGNGIEAVGLAGMLDILAAEYH
ncbi:MAG: ATP-binding protein [Verrucomicrobiota bacterium]